MTMIDTDRQDAPQLRSERGDASGLVFLVGMALVGALTVVLSLAAISPGHTAATPTAVSTR
jgi:hypothetical protein